MKRTNRGSTASAISTSTATPIAIHSRPRENTTRRVFVPVVVALLIYLFHLWVADLSRYSNYAVFPTTGTTTTTATTIIDSVTITPKNKRNGNMEVEQTTFARTEKSRSIRLTHSAGNTSNWSSRSYEVRTNRDRSSSLSRCDSVINRRNGMNQPQQQLEQEDDEDDEECCLLNETCLQETARRIARLWIKKPLHWWCTTTNTSSTKLKSRRIPELDDESEDAHGILWLVKVPKSASSTMAGLVLRIANRHRCSNVYWEHGSARQNNVTQKLLKFGDMSNNNINRSDVNGNAAAARKRLFLLAPIRNPYHRALSDLYFHRVSLQQPKQAQQQKHRREQRRPSDSFIIRGLQEMQSNYITEYTRLWETNSWVSTKGGKIKKEWQELKEPQEPEKPRIVEIVQSILYNYDFLFLVEEMTKSLVVFAWITGLSAGDLMVASSKQSGSWYSQKKRCVRLVPPVVTPNIRTFIESNQEWKRQHMMDRLLHAAVQQSLNLTLERLQQIHPTVNVEEMIQRWQQLQADLEKACVNETYWPCSATGELQLYLARQSCYARDFGCGHACYDRQSSSLTFSQRMADTL